MRLPGAQQQSNKESNCRHFGMPIVPKLSHFTFNFGSGLVCRSAVRSARRWCTANCRNASRRSTRHTKRTKDCYANEIYPNLILYSRCDGGFSLSFFVTDRVGRLLGGTSAFRWSTYIKLRFREIKKDAIMYFFLWSE